MEDGFPLFDPNDESARQEQKLREYYEEFSANARKRLLAKAIVRPTTVYDVLYPQTREVLLSKNKPFNTDLEEDAKIIRDRLIAKLVTNETDLEKISEDFRKSLLARGKIQEDRDNLLRNSEAFRNDLLSKNSNNQSNLEKSSEQVRLDNIAKNKPNLSLIDNIDKNSDAFREKGISKNSAKDQDLLRDSESFRNQFRKNDINKNVPNKSNIDKDSEAFRDNNISKNTKKDNVSLEDLSKIKRQDDLSKNKSNSKDLEDLSKLFRSGDLSKNDSRDQDLLRDSESFRNQFRKNDINKNIPNNSDLEKDSVDFRRNNISNNKNADSDLEIDSSIYRNNNTSKTNSGSANIDDIAEEKRSSSLAKNVSKDSNLENDSAQFRSDDLSNNSVKISNLEKDSAQFRSDDLSLNKRKVTDLEKDSAQFRSDDLSVNKPSLTDLGELSSQFRNDDLSLNKKNKTDLETDSAPFRKDDISANKPNFTNLEKDSAQFRSDDLSLNKPKTTDLEEDSVVFRNDDLSFNTPKVTDLENDSVSFREDDLSMNSPTSSNLEVDSVPFREDDLSANVLSTSDLATDSTPFLYNNLSSNVPSETDLANDSVPFREDDLSANVPSFSNLFTDSSGFRDNNTASNVPNNSDLAIDSVPFRALDLAANVPINTNIASNSIQFRDDNIAANVQNNSDLLVDSSSFRDDAISKNKIYGLLGVNVQGAGTSAFLGISRVFTQGILIRQLLFSKNKSKKTNLLLDSEAFRQNNKVPNRWQLGNKEYTSTNLNWQLGRIVQGSINTNLVDYSPLEPYYTPTAKAIFSTDDYIITKGRDMQNLYGTSQKVDFPTGRRNREINDSLFSVNTSSPKGGSFSDPFFKRQTYVPFSEGSVTSAIRNYAQERNAFNINNRQAGNPESLNTLNNFAQDGFQDLVQKTIGSFKAVFQARTLTTPTDIIQKNGGAYYNGGARNMDLLRPGAEGAALGSAESMMAKTTPGNPFEDEDFFTGKRGVKHIVNTIKGGDSDLASNFDPQNNTAYINGVNRDGSSKVSRQKFTIANPYAPGKAGKLIFFIKNYSSGDQFFFPPYIQSIQNTENANWNSTSFLGRPEAIYTYNNSSRDASISFYVLTDYTQSVDIGRDWGSDSMEKITANIGGHFTQSDVSQNNSRKLKEQELQKLKAEQNKRVDEINEKIDENSGQAVNLENQPEIVADPTSSDMTGQMSSGVDAFKKKAEQQERKKKAEQKENQSEGAALREERERLQQELSKTNDTIGESSVDFNKPTNYSETNNVGNNVYNINVTKKEFNNGEIISKPEDTINRINTMKQSLMFQPAFFSGDKVDFVRKMEFLSKLTRPAANDGNGAETGFSFTKPPICHIHLGDWWNHDIVVNSVSFDYADAPWTLDGGRVQPMWALVSINFNIIGPFRANNSRPPLSTDAGGMFSPIGGITSDNH